MEQVVAFAQQLHESVLPAWFMPRPAHPFLDYGLTQSLSEASGVPEPSLRLLLTVLAGYPISIVYRLIFLNKTSTIIGEHARNWFLVVMGLLMSYYFNSLDIIHPLTTAIGTWLICKTVGMVAPRNRALAASTSFVFNFGYLLTSYKYAATEEYDICYTMQQCVQCLRMIGYAMDFMDGQPKSKKEKPSSTGSGNGSVGDGGGVVAPSSVAPEEKNAAAVVAPPAAVAQAPVPREKTPISFGRDIALGQLPTLPETIAYAFFPFAFLVGPQFSFSLYKKFITMDLFAVPIPATAGKEEVDAATRATANGVIPQGSLRYATRCFFLGVFYLALGQVLAGFFPTVALLGKDYVVRPMPEKLFIFWWTGKTILNKYLGIWTIAEGPCVLSGLTFNGYDQQGRPEWDGLRNVNPLGYEFATSLAQIITSFNMNTNHWAKLYVFKRLRFLGNKNLSALGVLLFLAVWHGTHPGYFICFGLEFLDMETERRLRLRIGKPVQQWLEKKQGAVGKVLRAVWATFTWALTTSALYFACIPFDLLQFDKSMTAMRAIHFAGFWVMAVLLFSDVFLSVVMPKKKKSKSE
ncbi:hypothetical protein DFQ27_009630 [Actinomortierella ambigua]|uniref:Lysophospholipid acyltransferase 5 n=1 Tax=Actinomortierella ambigua TaxID=1343610 RepID=A0A9P6U9N1_9FUNG|nr:hypothetical protein DFQ27_009630 [Actinomortierella ambigua]